ncbi:MAG: hypothetical protein ACOYOV_14235 [Bacteroidales bacterium]
MTIKLSKALKEMQERTRDETSRTMDDATFNELFDAGDFDLLLMDGGTDLTPSQMAKVKAKGKKDSEEKLQKMAFQIACQPGYQEMMLLPLMSKLIPQGLSPNPARGYQYNMGANGRTGGLKEAEDSRDSETIAYEKDNQEKNLEDTDKLKPIEAKTSESLQENDSEAEILNKMFNLMKMEYEFKNGIERQDKKHTALEDDKKKGFLEEIIESITGKKSLSSRMKKFTRSVKKSNLPKYALLGAAGAGAFMLSKNALANIDWKSMVPDFGGIAEDGIDKLEGIGKRSMSGDLNAPGFTGDTSSTSTHEQSEDSTGAKQSAEKYYGKKISDKDWELILKTTAAESANDTKSQSMVMGSILNRARESDDPEAIRKTLEKRNQFQAVTGTAENDHKPSPKFIAGPSKSEQKSLNSAAMNLPNVSYEQKNIAATDPKAYGPGTTMEWVKGILKKPGSSVIAGSAFNTTYGVNAPGNNSPVVANQEIPTQDTSRNRGKSRIILNNNQTNVVAGGTTNQVVINPVDDNPALVGQQYR